MNPEEGDLRPQLLDRFAHAVDVVGIDRCPSSASRFCAAASSFEQDPEASPMPTRAPKKR
jgi:magnesium chelatase subunit I